MKITLRALLDEYRHDNGKWFAHAVWHCMTMHKPNASEGFKVFGLKPIESGADDQEVDVRVTVNGVEVPFESFISHVEVQHERMIREAARAMFNERLQTLDDSVYRMGRLIKDELSKLGFGEDE